jgi:hypothetical protein
MGAAAPKEGGKHEAEDFPEEFLLGSQAAFDLDDEVIRQAEVVEGGIRLRRDSWVSVMYAEELNSTTSSVTLQRTDRHGILGQKSAHCQMSL